MIIWGLLMQEKEHIIPKEVSDWLAERNGKYPKIKFEINGNEVKGPQPQIEEYLKLGEQYQKFYSMNGPMGGCLTVQFPYKKESWSVKIMGLMDKDGNIVNTIEQDPAGKNFGPLPAELRNTIAGIPTDKEKTAPYADGKVILEIREGNNPFRELPEEMVTIEPDFRNESEFHMSGAELEQFMNDPRLDKEEMGKAFHEKDWEKLRRMRSGLNN